MTSTSAMRPTAQAETPMRGWRFPLLLSIALVGGAGAGLNWLSASEHPDKYSTFELKFTSGDIVTHVGVAGLCYAGVLVALCFITARLIAPLPAQVRGRFFRFEPLTNLPALLTLLGWKGIQFPPPLIIFLLIVAAKAGLVVQCLGRERRGEFFASTGWLAFLFLISGFAALIYQIVWQRALFAAFGVNIESITIIVSLFMLGLGVGSAVGGAMGHWFPRSAPMLFLLCEAGIGLFGIFSLPLIERVGAAMLHGSLWQVSAAVFALLCIPTMLMGATLPILVKHLNRHLRNVGRSVGLLYCINTLGSAIACFITADVLFIFFGQQTATYAAAGCNFMVGLLVWKYAQRIAQRGEGEGIPVAEVQTMRRRESPGSIAPPSLGRSAFVLFFSAATGYISLSQEMLWMRIISYMTGGRPSVFAHVLGFFLVGVAFGAYAGERICERMTGGGRSPARFVGGMLVLSGLFYYLSIVFTARVNLHHPMLGLLATHLVVAVVSFLLGGIFPVLCQLAAHSGRDVGIAVSRVYLANVVGSTLGPLLTGFVLMEYFGTGQIILGFSIAALGLGTAAFLMDSGRPRLVPVGWGVVSAVAFLLFHGQLYGNFLEKLQFQGSYEPTLGKPYKHLIETRSGIIAAVEGEWGDILYGGGVYDGKFNIDPLIDSNLIRRAYLIAALHPEPKQILEIGLASGSWSRVIANYAPVQRSTIVEISKGYLDIIGRYPDQATLLRDPKVKIEIDDGRRWLNRHPDARFDIIVQNTTWHWREHATHVLSREYMEMCKRRLNPGGAIYCNTTWSSDISHTLSMLFKHVVSCGTFVAASDRPFDMPPARVRENLLKFSFKGAPTFDLNNPWYVELLDEMANTAFPDFGPEFRGLDKAWLITDDNMATEYKTLMWKSPDWEWSAFFRRREKK